ncbi:hypothetical protein, partial [Rhizobium sp. BK377]|uniref:hypothetical protein n=1 Tax=Rhizobium sp. BK377 TaxID=2587058 RepID=UPI001AED5960
SFKEPNLLSSASSAAHVSLSSHLQLSNNRRHFSRRKINAPNLKPRATNQHAANPLDFFRTRNFVASSAAALVSEWAYNPTPSKQSTHPTQLF